MLSRRFAHRLKAIRFIKSLRIDDLLGMSCYLAASRSCCAKPAIHIELLDRLDPDAFHGKVLRKGPNPFGEPNRPPFLRHS